MTVADALYTLVISPLELLLDVIYSYAMKEVADPGLAIVHLSLALNLLVLPLYLKADAMQREEKEDTRRLKPGVDHINSVFEGDERFLVLQTYYRQNHYKPYYVLKGALSLLLQIPFFIAAYHYLSNLSVLRGAAFGPVQDLGAPDSLLHLAGFSVNVLPLLMTVINLFSGMLYTRGMPLKSKVQLYGMALIFLVLLYPSPSGLVFYWTLNNLFSLVKNMISRLPDPRAFVRRLCSAAGIGIFLFCLCKHPQGQIAWIAALMQLPLCIEKYEGKQTLIFGKKEGDGKQYIVIFLLSCSLLALLTGLLIPSIVICSSPGEFVDAQHFTVPVKYVIYAGLYACGMFLLWFGIFYSLASNRVRTVFSAVTSMLAFVAVVDFLFFGGNYGTMSSTFVYDFALDRFAQKSVFWNQLAVAGTAIAVLVLFRAAPNLLKVLCLACCIAILGTGGRNVLSIQQQTKDLESIARRSSEKTATLTLDRKGKNVVVVMLDRAISEFVPYLMYEKPELLEQFAGFTYYPNTISYGCHTNTGAPGLFGGYEYTPEEMNKRGDVLLADKHNEALKLMPVLFSQSGFEVTVCDPPYGNYQEITDLSIYDDYPEIHGYVLEANQMNDYQGIYDNLEQLRKRNLFCYSLFRASPVLYQSDLYEDGLYHEVNAEYAEEPDTLETVPPEVLSSYFALKNLPYISEITNSGNDTFFMMTSNMTHIPYGGYQEPEYVLVSNADNREYEKEHRIRFTAEGDRLDMREMNELSREHYMINMAALVQLGNWFDYLREMRVYDNTRIILVSDHGFGFYDAFGYRLNEKYQEIFSYYRTELAVNMYTSSYVAFLMVKDLGSREFTTDYRFMTNADTPLIALKDLINDPVNPFTGQRITDKIKREAVHHIIESYPYISTNRGTTFEPSVSIPMKNDDIFERSNWPVDWYPD